MRKINYPTDTQVLQKLKDDYLAIFQDKLPQMQSLWEPMRDELRELNNNSEESQRLYPDNVKDLLVANYDLLVDLYLNYSNLQGKKVYHPELHMRLRQLFHYSEVKESKLVVFQPRIADYFMKHARMLGVYVCNYCEMAYVNEFGFKNRYDDIASFLLLGTEREIRHYVRNSSGAHLATSTIKKIKQLRINNDKAHIVEVFDSMREWANMIHTKKSKQIEDQLHNHFDLDHFLPRSKCPLMGLSLFNFVPSCSVCNEKLKGAEELTADGSREGLLVSSPTSPYYEFDEEVTIKVIPHVGANWLRAQEHEQDFHVELLTDNSNYQNLIEVFRLEERYNYHKCEALRLQDKLLEYPDDKLCMMSSALGGGTYTPQKIREDLLEIEFAEKKHRCFSKMKCDIIKNA